MGRKGIGKLSLFSIANSVQIGQFRNYRSGMKKLLEKQGTAHEPIEIVIVLGCEPSGWESADSRATEIQALEAFGARVVFYDELLANAGKAYADYFSKRKFVDKLDEIIRAIEDYAPPTFA